MSKDKETKEHVADLSSSSSGAQSAAVAPTSPPVVPLPAPAMPTCHTIVTSIKVAGQSLSQTDRNEIIRTVSSLPPPATTAAAASPYDGRTKFAFCVSWSQYQSNIEATSPTEAWALFCDSIKQYPSPKAGKIECLGEAAQLESDKVKAEAVAAPAK